MSDGVNFIYGFKIRLDAGRNKPIEIYNKNVDFKR